MTPLNTSANLQGADDLYQRLVELTAGLDESESLRVQAKLILLLANHIGDRQVIEQAIDLSRPVER